MLSRTLVSRAQPFRVPPQLGDLRRRRVRVGAAAADPDTGLASSTSTTTVVAALVALVVVVGTIVWASRSAAADFA
jgi:hypothetical protein